MKVWIAREVDNRIFISTQKPLYQKTLGLWIAHNVKSNEVCIVLSKDDPIGVGITFENSPQEIELERKS